MSSTFADRDALIERAYHAGGTMQSIADDAGLTRGRIQQILAARGVDTTSVRQGRRAGRQADLDVAVAELWERHGSTVAALAEDHASRDDVVAQFRVLLPDVDSQLLRRAIDASTVKFDRRDEDRNFTEPALRLGVMYVLGLDIGATADAGAAVVGMDRQDTVALEQALLARGFAAARIAEIAAVAWNAIERSRNESLSMTKDRYSELRDELAAQSQTPATHPWPADAQTVMKRLGGGYWNDAVEGLGLTRSDRGRARGLQNFTEVQYQQTLREFVESTQSLNLPATAAQYERWRGREMQAHRSHPSFAAVRDHYRSWHAALRTLEEVSKLRGGAAEHEALLASSFLAAAVQDMERGLEAVRAAPGAAERDSEVVALLHAQARHFELDRRKWVGAAVEADPSSGTRRLAKPAGRLTKARHARLAADPANPSAVIQDRYLDGLLQDGPAEFDGWFSADVQAELDRLRDLAGPYEVLRAARNFVEHSSTEAAERLRTALDSEAERDASFAFPRKITYTTFVRWLAAQDAARLRKVVSAPAAMWALMRDAEAKLLTSEISSV